MTSAHEEAHGNAAGRFEDDKTADSDTIHVDQEADNVAGEPKEEPKRTITGFKWFFAYTSLLASVLLFALDNTIVANIQPSIVSTFRQEDLLQWIGVSFVLGQAIILPLGKAFGCFNMKLLFCISVVLFEVGSAICGASPNMTALIIGRVIAGIGGSGVYVGGMTYIAILTTPHERPLYLAGIMSIWGLGNVLGPIIGGAFAQSSATWRWGFYINLPIAAIFAPAYLFCLPSINAMPDLPVAKKLKLQDWLGIVVFLAFCACFAMAGSFGGTLYSWQSGSEIALWVMTGVLFVAFIVVTIFHPGVPANLKLLPVHFMRTKDLIILPIESFLVAGSMFMSIYYTPLVFQFTRGDGPLEAGVRILPLICMIVFGSLLNGVLMPKLGYYMPWYVIGNALLVAGAACMATITPTTSDSAIYGYTVLIGLGVGCFQSAGIAVVSALTPSAEVNNAVSIMVIGQVVGTIMSLAVAGSIFQNVAINDIAAVLPNATHQQVTSLVTGASGSFYQSLSSAQSEMVVEAVTTAIRSAFYFLCGSTALGFILSLFLSPKKLFLTGGTVAT